MRACVCVCVYMCVYIYIYTHTHTHTHTYIYIYIYIYIYNFIHTVLIKTIKNDTFKQSVQTTVPVHTFTGNGNTLINSQQSLRGSEVCPSAALVVCLGISKW